MTGKFHKSWGEFGGYKHPIALRYEALAAGARGARFPVGDQLHPHGALDTTTYSLIGDAYAALEAAEPWLKDATSVAHVAVFTAEAANNGRADRNASAGVDRVGGNLQTDIGVSTERARYSMTLSTSRQIGVGADPVKPDQITICTCRQIGSIHASGGRATGGSCIDDNGTLVADLGLEVKNTTQTTAFHTLILGIPSSSSHQIAHRDPHTVTSALLHQHTPNSNQAGAPVATRGAHGSYIAYDVFDIYAREGQAILRDFVLHIIRSELGGRLPVETNLLALIQRLTHMRQDALKRDIIHLLFATPSCMTGRLRSSSPHHGGRRAFASA